MWTTFVTDIDYDAKGQRERIDYGNGVDTTYDYDPLTFRLVRLQTLRGSEPLQDLSYTYDPVGNITHIATTRSRRSTSATRGSSRAPTTPTTRSIG